MGAPSLGSILARLIALTAERDSNSLEISLVQTLFDLAAPGELTIYKLANENKQEFLLLGNDGTVSKVQVAPDLQEKLHRCLIHNAMISVDGEGGKTLLMHPLNSAKNRPLAVIAIQSESENVEMQQLTLMLLQIYKNFMALINDNERDTLTGLLNRKTFETRINHVINRNLDAYERARETEQQYYLAIFDIDHFKRVNDTFGHMVGDEVLLLFSRIVTDSFREDDLLFRFGGEEFVGVFKCETEDSIHQMLERFKHKVQTYSFPQVGQVTVSAGYTVVRPFDTTSNIIDRADAALYYAKNAGRNRVCKHEELIEQGKLQENKVHGEVEMF